MRTLATKSFCFWVRYSKNLTLSMKLRFWVYSFSHTSATAFRKVLRSIPQRVDFSIANRDADLGALYRSANSPNPSPGCISRRCYPLMITLIFPFSSTKNELASSPWFIMKSFLATSQQKNLESRSAMIPESSTNYRKTKCFDKHFSINWRSSFVFFRSILLKFS